jgi:hypothetical protein
MAAHERELTARALVAESEEENIDPVDRAFYRRAQLLHAADLGEYFEEVAA